MNAISYKEVFPLIKDNKLWLGYSIHSGDRAFNVPDNYPIRTSLSGIDDHGKRYVRVNGVRWFTNIEHGLRHAELILDTMANNLRFNKSLKKKLAKYGDEKHYPKYDNYDAIEIPITKCIPSDYKGKMGVPISFLDKYNPDQFEIIGGFNGSKLEDKAKFDYVQSTNTPAIISGKDKLWNGPTIHKQTLYYRIIIKSKHPK